jgi:hypothetical protein
MIDHPILTSSHAQPEFVRLGSFSLRRKVVLGAGNEPSKTPPHRSQAVFAGVLRSVVTRAPTQEPQPVQSYRMTTRKPPWIL